MMYKSAFISFALLILVPLLVFAQGNAPLKLLHTTPLPGLMETSATRRLI